MSAQIEFIEDGETLVDVSRAPGVGVDAGEVLTIEELARFEELPMELHRLRVSEGHVIGGGPFRETWCLCSPYTHAAVVMVLIDPNFPSFVDVFEVEPGERGAHRALGKAVMLGWNGEVQQTVRAVHEVDDWQPEASAPVNAELWVKDAAGRYGLMIREANGPWWPLAGEVKTPVAWAWPEKGLGGEMPNDE